MKKKLLFIATILVSSFAFTACEEEIIAPQTEVNDGDHNGDVKDDSGQWD